VVLEAGIGPGPGGLLRYRAQAGEARSRPPLRALAAALGALVPALVPAAAVLGAAAGCAPARGPAGAPVPPVGRHRLGGARPEVHNLAGRTSVEPGAGPGVVVEVLPEGRDAARLRAWIDRRPEGDALWLRPGRRGEARAAVRVRVPPGARLLVQVGAGAIEARDVCAELGLRAVEGGITLVRVRGPRVVARSSAGPVWAEEVEGDDVALTTQAGSLTARGVRARRIRLETGAGSLEATRIEAGRLDVEADAGSVTLERVRADTLRLDADAGRRTLRDVRAGAQAGEGPARLGGTLFCARP